MTEKPEAPANGGSTDGGGTTNGGSPPGGGGGTPEGGGGTPEGGGGQTDPHPKLPWDEAQNQMLKGMTQDQKNAYFQSEPGQQDAAVQEWHQENFGYPTSTDMPTGGPVVEGKYMPGGSEFGQGQGH